MPLPGFPRIVVLGIGQAGGNALMHMAGVLPLGVEFRVYDTSTRALERFSGTGIRAIAARAANEFGTGANPPLGRQAALEDLDLIIESCGDEQILFIVAGMGGGTGSGAVPVVAKAARERGVLTFAVVTTPLASEGVQRGKVAEEAVGELAEAANGYVVVPMETVLSNRNRDVKPLEVFAVSDEWMLEVVRGLLDCVAGICAWPEGMIRSG